MSEHHNRGSLVAGGVLESALALRALPAFAHMDDGMLSLLAAACEEQRVNKNQVLLAEGERMERAIVVLDGRVRVEDAGKVVARTKDRLGLGVLGMLARRTARRSAIAEQRCTALVLHRARLMDVIEDEPLVLEHLLRFITGGIIDTFVALERDFQAPEKLRPIPIPLQDMQRDPNLVERILAIREVPAFGRSSITSIARYAQLATPRRVSRGQELWLEGDPAHTYVHLVQGQLICEQRSARGVLTYGPPAMPGLFEVLAGRGKRWHNAIAAEDCLLLEVGAETLFDLFEDDLELATLCLELLAQRLIQFHSLDRVATQS